jgi:branched-chain amino acid transport system substrate-binding protein
MKSKGVFWLILVIIIVVLILIFTNQSSAPVGEGETVKIGVSVPLSGEAVTFGESALAGIKLAQKEINEKGGILGKSIELVVEDNSCTTNGGANSVSKLVNVDKILAFIGPVCSTSASTGLPIIQSNKIPTVLSGSTAPDLASLGDYIFRNLPADSLQGTEAANFIYDQLGKRKAAIIYVQNPVGIGLKDNFSKRFEDLGGEILFNEGITQETLDIKTQITKIKDTEADILYFAVYPNNAVAGLKQIKEMGLNLVVFGSDSIGEDESVVKKDYSDGLIFTVAKTNNPEDFQSKVKEVMDVSLNYFTPYSYDALYILAEAIERAGSLDREEIRDELAKTSYSGVALPLVEFDENGDLKEAEFEVRVIKNGESVPYTP